MTEPALELNRVSKRYWRIEERSLLRSLVPFGAPNRSELWALQDVTFSVGAGETVGILGPNGAGKSTMLRMLAGVTQPTSGQIVTRGRVAPMLSVGTGFHPEMTGRENILVNGQLLGLSKDEIKARFDDIVAFADIPGFIDTPVKFYSSGMYMRLGFSVAVHVDPDVLLVDEVLAVGDTGFRIKSFERLQALQQSGTALVFVSHFMQMVQMLCPRAICMSRGAIEYDGEAEGAIARYHEVLHRESEGEEHGPVRVLAREFTTTDGKAAGVVDPDDLVVFRAQLRFEVPVANPLVEFRVAGEDSTMVYAVNTPFGESWRSFEAGEEATVAVLFRPLVGSGGTFHPSILVMDQSGAEVYLHDHGSPAFFVSQRNGVAGTADFGASILIDGDRRIGARQSYRLEQSVTTASPQPAR